MNKLWNLLVKIQKNPKDILYYMQGNIRYKLYYSKRFKKLIRKHIREQIDYRIEVMDQECYKMGVCKMCGCTTTALQMCNKRCNGNCYFPMLNKEEWGWFKIRQMITLKEGTWMMITTIHTTIENKQFKIKSLKHVQPNI